jgi:hypothetical protein
VSTTPTDPNGFPMQDTKFLVALGVYKGFSLYRKYGVNNAVNGSGTAEDIWPIGTIRVLPSAAAVVSTVSSSIQDDADLVGTGAWTVQIEGLDADYVELTETVTLNGTGAVTTNASFLRINRAYVVTAGSGETNAGNITLSISGVAQAYIEALEGQTHQCMLTVPAGKTFFVTDYHAIVGRMAGATDCQVIAYIKPYRADGNSAWRSISNVYLYNGNQWQGDNTVTAIPEKTEARIQAISTAVTEVSAVFSGYLVENKYI